MEKLSMCRICLVENVRMCVVTNKSLQEMYEKLADVPFVTEDRKPMLACLFCCTRLKQCCQLQRQCVEAEELLAQLLSEDCEQKPLTDRGHLEFFGRFIITPIENISIADDCQIGSDAIKQELPAVCEEQGVVELQPAQPTEDLDPENLHNSHSDVEAHYSEPESEEEQLLVEIKIEGEEEQDLSENLRVRETENFTPENLLNSHPDVEVHHSEPESEEEQLLVEVKIGREEEQELPENRTVRLTKKAAASKKQTPKRKLDDTIPAKQKMKRGKKCINSLEDQKKALLRYKSLFENNRIPPPSDLVYAIVQSALPKPMTQMEIYLSVKKNFKYFFDVPDIIEDDSIRDSREAAVAKKPLKRKLEKTLPAKPTMNVLSDSKIIRTAETSTSESVAKIKEPVTTTSQSSFSQSSNLIKHTRIHTDVKTFICDICHRSYSAKKSLEVHFRIHTGEKPYKCDICQLSFHTKCILNAHRQIHSGVMPYKCNVCQKGFCYSTNLANHLCKHSGEKPFKCDVCQRSFRLKRYLVLHLREHSGEKPYKCDVCQRSFSCKSRLTRHVYRHSDVRPFKCDICQRSFKEKDYLKRHSVVHTGIKPFNCDICQCSFTAKTSLIVHNLRKHSDEKPFKCDVCQRRFCDKSSLNRHSRTHTGEKPFKCDVCQHSFSTKRGLEAHFKRHSGEKPLK